MNVSKPSEKYKLLKQRRATWMAIVIKDFRKSKHGIVGSVIVVMIFLMALMAPIIAPGNPQQPNYGMELLPPSIEFPFGTDNIGRSVFHFVVWGTRNELLIGLVATLIAMTIGTLVGAFAGYYGGIIDMILMRITDAVAVIPIFFLLIIGVSMFQTKSLWLIASIIGIVTWPYFARIVRSEFVSLKERTYVLAAKSIGASDFRIIFRHILPNAAGSIIVTATIYVAYAILLEAGLSFLGLGDPTATTWGIMLNTGRDLLRRAPWVATFPGLFIFLTSWGFNLLGDGLRDALAIRERKG
mgnify:CR=1 FL=1